VSDALTVASEYSVGSAGTGTPGQHGGGRGGGGGSTAGGDGEQAALTAARRAAAAGARRRAREAARAALLRDISAEAGVDVAELAGHPLLRGVAGAGVVTASSRHK
jgi:hypothetical protein